MTALWQRLRDRKLVQWALAYAAGAFALLQGVDIVAGKFGWPEAIERGLIVALCIGFFLALVLAWYHGERGAQRVSGTELAILALLLAIGGGLLWRTAPGERPVDAGVPAKSAPAGPAADAVPILAKSIAVLPFENLSADKDNEYFASGMQDMILGKLGEIGDLAVASRTSTLKYRSRPDNLKAVARELGVAHILEGSVQKSGNQVLISLQLIDAVADQHRWAQSYRRTLDDIFGVEGEIAQTVADELKAKLTGAEAAQVAKVPTRNKEAYDLFLRAGYFLDTANRLADFSYLERTIELDRQAVALDPGFVDAYAELALAYDKLGRIDEAEPAARRALELDRGSAQANRLMAYVTTQRGDPDAALVYMREAVRLAPSRPAMHLGLGFTLQDDGHAAEALVEFERAIALDPTDNFYRGVAAKNELSLRRYRRGQARIEELARRDPGDLGATVVLADAITLASGDLAASRKILQASTASAAESGVIAMAWYEHYRLAHDYAAAIGAIRQAPQKWLDVEHRSRGEFVGAAERLQGHVAEARAAYLAAQGEIGAWLDRDPNNETLHANLAVVLAALGDHAQALSEAARARSLNRVKSREVELLLTIARTQVLTARYDDAFASLEELLALPAGHVLSAATLRLDPDWDVLRHDPRFDALVARYAQAEKDAER